MTDFFINLDKYMKFKRLNDNKITIQAGISNGLIGRGRKRGSMSQENISKILYRYEELNANWLLTGKGKMLKEDATIKENKPVNMIPFYDGIAVGGTQKVSVMDDVSQPAEYIDAGGWFRDATAAMRVHGDSMHPIYKNGSIVALKLVNNKQLVIYGQDYVVETDEYCVIKRLQKADKKLYWSCYSINEDKYLHNNRLIHEPFDVPIDAVNKLFKVLGCVTRTESSRIVFNTKSTY